MGEALTRPVLEVLIAACGAASLERMKGTHFPKVDGVAYLVAWQQPDGEIAVPDELARRDDFRFVIHRSRGLTRNRNVALDNAAGEFLLIADDDVSYTADSLRAVIDAYRRHPSWEFIFFQYDSDIRAKRYPAEAFEFPHLPKGYYSTSFEMSFRRSLVERLGLRFDEDFGIGGRKYLMGEEDVLLHSLLHSKARGGYLPKAIVFHPGDTTGQRLANSRSALRTKRAILRLYHPWTWPLRYLVHLIRIQRHPGQH